MKQLLVLRHAKSSWADPDTSDFERPLNRRGERDAPLIGAWLADQGYQPGIIVSSPSLRTTQTSRLVADAADLPPSIIHFDKRIYDAELSTLIALVRGFNSDWPRVLLIGHNPGLHELVNTLGNKVIESFPTCALAVLEFAVNCWDEIRPGRGKIVRQVTPKTLD